MIRTTKHAIWRLYLAKQLFIIFILLIFFSIPQTSLAKTYQKTLKAKAIEMKLYEDNAWLSLLHYRKHFFYDGHRSEADNPNFFLSTDGAIDPQSELSATIEAMFLPQKLGDDHPQCIFPARFTWLKNMLYIDLSRLPVPACNLYQEWRQKSDTDQVTLVFPTAFLNNPSSMFGHAFLRFETPDRAESKLLMTPTINFAADTSAQKGVVDYILRGLFGGFPSKNSIQPFYKRLKRYTDIENRDIWEYTLNFTQEELNQLLRHVWELRENVFDYYFLDENCAYRLLSLLEVGRPSMQLTEEFKIYTIPVDVIRALKLRGLIQEITYRASAVKTFYHHLQRLNNNEKHIVIDIIHNQLSLDSDQVLSLPVKRRALVLALASEYLAILINKDILDRDLSTQLTCQIFAERSKHFVPITLKKIIKPDVSPDEGHKTQRVSISGGFDKNNTFYAIGYRGVYHGLIDPLHGFEKGAQVELLNVALRGYEDDDIRLEKLNLINIRSLTPFDKFLTPASWRFSVGREKKELYDKHPLSTYIEGGMGVTFRLADLMLSGMIHLELDFGSAFDKGYGLGSGVYFNIVYQSDKFSCDIGGLAMKYLVGDSDTLTKFWNKISFPIRPNNAIFLETKYSPNNRSGLYEVSFGIHHYF